MTMITVTVSEIVQESPSVKSFRLVRSDGTPMGRYSPGAHIDVVGPTSVTRQYSLCSTPDAEDSFAFAVKREKNSRGGSSALHELRVGDTLQISEPRNLLSIDPSAEHNILVAAGIGITPMLSMARYMDVHDISFELHYYASSEEEAAFLPMLMDRCPEKLHAHMGVAREQQEELLRQAIGQSTSGTHVYTCGPEGFMDKVMTIVGEKLPQSAIHCEAFHPKDQDESENTPFEVELEGETYTVPAEKSIVEVLQENGADIDTSCEEGICGTCIMQVLGGTPEHRDSVLTADEKDSGELIAVCVSRCASEKLILDYY